ncbi:MAG TPA: hypothetical protein VMU75_03075 [Acidimicrobiales bacterium]|nr:hypothetical protein [Acidimicrobiales bacterium]
MQHFVPGGFETLMTSFPHTDGSVECAAVIASAAMTTESYLLYDELRIWRVCHTAA